MVHPSIPLYKFTKPFKNWTLRFALALALTINIAIREIVNPKGNCAPFALLIAYCQINYKSLHRTEQWIHTDKFCRRHLIVILLVFFSDSTAIHMPVYHARNNWFFYYFVFISRIKIETSLSVGLNITICRLAWICLAVIGLWFDVRQKGGGQSEIIEIDWCLNYYLHNSYNFQPSNVLTETEERNRFWIASAYRLSRAK